MVTHERTRFSRPKAGAPGIRLLAGAALLATMVLAISVARAAPRHPEPLPTRTVRTADLDLSRPQGVRVLQRRVGVAVREVCGNQSLRELTAFRQMMQCRKETAALAAVQVAALLDRTQPVRLAETPPDARPAS